MHADKKKIITIAGRPGSGKSSTAKTIATELGYQHFSSGDLFRALGRELGIDVLQTNLSAEKGEIEVDVDRLVDERLQTIGATEDRVIIDSRTAWHWIPGSFKVFLDLDLNTAAERILATMDDDRLASEHIKRDPVEYAELLKHRLESETRRYKALYNIDPYVMSNYDLVINTGEHNLTEVVQQVLSAYRSWLEQAGRHV
ncbi:MAG TPA: nucleoside monophosphate kinase [Candidatus Saccharimonadales bacterium]|nr:nucleoside monophosphate kinase [Candidatus Saccharimonadales bacterium]